MHPKAGIFRRKHQPSLFLTLVACVVLATASGCQTCSLSKDDFEKQQRGQTVDKETGDAVAVVGTLGYCSAMMGELIATLLAK
jgi:hypothetical protein